MNDRAATINGQNHILHDCYSEPSTSCYHHQPYLACKKDILAQLSIVDLNGLHKIYFCVHISFLDADVYISFDYAAVPCQILWHYTQLKTGYSAHTQSLYPELGIVHYTQLKRR
uniref:Uncharacterized protein n=1 Tax=Rhipicephalus zambeziensis TaxID=60191 RepID=A0A224Y9L5_9ACAR